MKIWLNANTIINVIDNKSDRLKREQCLLYGRTLGREFKSWKKH